MSCKPLLFLVCTDVKIGMFFPSTFYVIKYSRRNVRCLADVIS